MDKRISVVVKVVARPDKAAEMRAVVLSLQRTRARKTVASVMTCFRTRPSLKHSCWSRNGQATRISTRTT